MAPSMAPTEFYDEDGFPRPSVQPGLVAAPRLSAQPPEAASKLPAQLPKTAKNPAVDPNARRRKFAATTTPQKKHSVQNKSSPPKHSDFLLGLSIAWAKDGRVEVLGRSSKQKRIYVLTMHKKRDSNFEKIVQVQNKIVGKY